MSTPHKTRSKRTAIIAQHDVSLAKTDLEEMAKRPKSVSLGKVVAQIEPQIRVAIAQGYSPEDVCAVLAKHNIAISPVTLKRYLKRMEDKGGGEKGEYSIDPASPAFGETID